MKRPGNTPLFTKLSDEYSAVFKGIIAFVPSNLRRGSLPFEEVPSPEAKPNNRLVVFRFFA